MTEPCYCKRPKDNGEGICKNCGGMILSKPKKPTKKETNLSKQFNDLKSENEKLRKLLRRVEVEGWKSKDIIEVEKIGSVWEVTTHSKDKLSGEIAVSIHKIPEVNVGSLWDLLQKTCKTVGTGITYRKLVPSIIETYHFPIELEEFNGGKNRAKYYFPFYYYPLKILESLGFIRYGGRGKIVRLK